MLEQLNTVKVSRSKLVLKTLFALSTVFSACEDSTNSKQKQGSAIIAPTHFPALGFPEANVPTEAKIKLGRHLFYDKALSGNQTYSCATCHRQELAFTDGLAVAKGSTNEHHSLGSMSLANIAYASTLGWGNPTLETLEAQALVPMFGEEPVELGLSELSEEALLERFSSKSEYIGMFKDAFPTEESPISVGNISKAIASFERTLISDDSPYDRYLKGDPDALNESELRGMDLFFSETLECFHCHGGFNLSDAVKSPDFPFSEKPFHNNGMYNINGGGRYPSNQGVFEHTRDQDDLGVFKAPTLRNIALTAPYLHDGSVDTLEELIELYAQGGRVITEGENAGDGTQHPNKSSFVAGFDITEQEKTDLIAFLRALTDETFISNPKFSDPFAD